VVYNVRLTDLWCDELSCHIEIVSQNKIKNKDSFTTCPGCPTSRKLLFERFHCSGIRENHIERGLFRVGLEFAIRVLLGF
jgi:hypothetical protein